MLVEKHMDKQKLEQLHHLNREIELLRRQINITSDVMVSDSVTASSKGFPYTQHLVIITGIEDCSKKLKRLKKQLYRRLQEVMDNVDEINEQIGEIPDSEMRQILTLRYINNLTWQQVAIRMGTAGDGSTERKKCDRFLNISPIS